MGHLLFDQYTYLHFAVGIIAYFWNISLFNWFILHIAFEILENSQIGMDFINKHITCWPGGKSKPDTIINSIGDIYGAMIGWISACCLDNIGNKYKWYTLHIK